MRNREPGTDGVTLYLRLDGDTGEGVSAWIPNERCHWVAALCLHNQEFGFTREDVEALKDAQYCLENDRGPGGFSHIKRIADRIEAPGGDLPLDFRMAQPGQR